MSRSERERQAGRTKQRQGRNPKRQGNREQPKEKKGDPKREWRTRARLDHKRALTEIRSRMDSVLCCSVSDCNNVEAASKAISFSARRRIGSAGPYNCCTRMPFSSKD